ncbi:MAG: HTH-type transcriptional regulator ChbR [Firmicutes bacterium ADurb.Bin248]|nr:MAG: HTH-type transcriptional regulator ChbR [Firmicutes bacterium ADurb.Bin248]HOG01269.1 AraC family transcriptional regulator [Clostridia bacterium]
MYLSSKRRNQLFREGGMYHVFWDKGFSGFAKPHSQAFHQYTVVESGRISQLHDGEIGSQFKGNVFFSPKDCEHSLFVYNDDTVYYTVSFSDEILNAAMEAVPGIPDGFFAKSSLFPMAEADHNTLIKLLGILMEKPEHAQPGVFNDWCHICAATVVMMLRAIGDARRSGQRDISENGTMDAVLRYIDQHYCEDFKIDDLIRISALRKSTFYAYFQSATGTTPKQYITEKRMREALRLIKDTDMPYSRIAEDVGYNDFSTFFRNFCRMTSRSPSEYRAQMEEEKKGL